MKREQKWYSHFQAWPQNILSPLLRFSLVAQLDAEDPMENYEALEEESITERAEECVLGKK